MTLKDYSAIYVFLSKSGIYVFKSKQYICQITSLAFHIILDGFRCLPSGFSYLTGGKLTTRSHPGKVLKILHFLWWVKESPPGYWGRVSEYLVRCPFYVLQGYISIRGFLKSISKNFPLIWRLKTCFPSKKFWHKVNLKGLLYLILLDWMVKEIFKVSEFLKVFYFPSAFIVAI